MRLVMRSAAAFAAAWLSSASVLVAQTMQPEPSVTTPVAQPPGDTAPTPSSTILSAPPAPIAAGRTAIMPAVAMREMTPAEERAHQVWSLRAALNVAALQCQFSPFLRTVKNYNLALPHHSAELASALKAIDGHFKRLDGPKLSRRSFDQYTTRTYNSFSTLEAQLTFCDKASEVGWEALSTKKGMFGDLAVARLTEIRNSLIPVTNPLLIPQLGWVEVPSIVNPCLDRRGRPKKKCK
jgi:hypothetical protein